MTSRSRARALAAGCLVIAGAAALAAAPWVPPHRLALAKLLQEDAGIVVECIGDGAWLDAAYFGGRVVAMAAPVAVAAALLAGLALRGRARAWTALSVHGVLLGGLACACWAAWGIERPGTLRSWLLVGGIAAATLVALELALGAACLKGRITHREPLTLHATMLTVLLIAGAVLAWKNRESQALPAAQYALIAAGALASLAGLTLESKKD